MKDLGDLSNPKCFTDPIRVDKERFSTLIKHYQSMLSIRLAEEKIGDAVTEGIVSCPCHLAIGQEAVAVGVSEHLLSTDKVFGGHRSHPHYLALGGSLYELFAEILGRVTGCSQGMGGSMHLTAPEKGFVGSVPIVAGTIAFGTGAALAMQKEGKGGVGVAYFGDGAVEEGAFHESLNFAARFSLPALFVVENNLYSSHLSISERQPANSVSRFAEAHQIKHFVVDGNDVESVSNVSKELIEHARSGKGPGFLEAVTYRWRGHVGPREDLDVGVRRASDHVQWKQRDPLARLKKGLLATGLITDSGFVELDQKTKTEVDSEWERALGDPVPRANQYLSFTYANEGGKP